MGPLDASIVERLALCIGLLSFSLRTGMGAAIRVAAQTALGESVMVLTASQGYEIWSAHYDRDPNPLLALESRLLAPRLGHLDGRTVLDVATGTGRWMSY